jgi:hypothetical protein
MVISKMQLFVPTVLPAGRLATAIRSGFVAAGQEPPDTFSLSETLPDRSKSDLTVDVAGLDRFCDLTSPNFSVRASRGDTGPMTWHYLAVAGGKPGLAGLNVQAPDGAGTEALIGGFLESAGLERFVPPAPVAETESANDASSPLIDVAKPVAPPIDSRLRLRCFLSYRFGNDANDEVARFLQRLLDLADVEVVTGRSYEPRPLGAKVADRLAGSDFLVLIVGADDGESAWTRDEIGTARTSGIPVIPLVATGATFQPGMFGDLERIPFDPVHPGDASIQLMEAVQYVRRSRERRGSV